MYPVYVLCILLWVTRFMTRIRGSTTRLLFFPLVLLYYISCCSFNSFAQLSTMGKIYFNSIITHSNLKDYMDMICFMIALTIRGQNILTALSCEL